MKNDGGPAFPCKSERKLIDSGPGWQSFGEFEPVGISGMSLRDYFAALAMQSIISGSYPKTMNLTKEIFAESSYRMADAMLAEREKG